MWKENPGYSITMGHLKFDMFPSIENIKSSLKLISKPRGSLVWFFGQYFDKLRELNGRSISVNKAQPKSGGVSDYGDGGKAYPKSLAST